MHEEQEVLRRRLQVVDEVFKSVVSNYAGWKAREVLDVGRGKALTQIEDDAGAANGKRFKVRKGGDRIGDEIRDPFLLVTAGVVIANSQGEMSQRGSEAREKLREGLTLLRRPRHVGPRKHDGDREGVQDSWLAA